MARLTQAKTYDIAGRLTSTEHQSGTGTTLNKYAYTDIDDFGRRKGVTLHDNTTWEYGYDDRSQVTSAVKKTSAGAVVTGSQFGASYDGIGNPTTREKGGGHASGNLRTYTPTVNTLNQITAQSTPSYLEVLGTSTASGLTVNGQATTRQGNRYSVELPVNNSTSAQRVELTVEGDIDDTVTTHKNLPAANQSYTHDADIGSAGVPPASNNDNLQNAGGVGGLLAINDHLNELEASYCFDGNGNVTALVEKGTGNLLAEYAYTAFGETLTAQGTHAHLNDYRFSTKPIEKETGHYYYLNRYYDPRDGRWLSRDPLGEEVFYFYYISELYYAYDFAKIKAVESERYKNPYRFIDNRVTNSFDVLGLQIEVDDKCGSCAKNPRRDIQTGRFASRQDLFDQVSKNLKVKPAGPGQRPPKIDPKIAKAIGAALGKSVSNFSDVDSIINMMKALSGTGATGKCVIARRKYDACVCYIDLVLDGSNACEPSRLASQAICDIAKAITQGVLK